VAPAWTARYADLTGKAAIVTGDDATTVVEVVRALAANGGLVAVVADRAAVDSAVAVAMGLDAQVFGMAADPADESAWARIVPHVEQRLGPIDIVVAIGEPDARAVLANAVVGDMAARRRGIVVEVGPDPVGPQHGGVRRRHVIGGEPDAIAAAVLLCASDAMPAVTLRLDLDS
jgi:hypothetical protein